MSIDLQVATDCTELPDSKLLSEWIELATKQRKHAEVLVRLVDEAESAELNETYRQKIGPTNVLSFPFERPEGLPPDVLSSDALGDLVICAPVVLKEAEQQGKKVSEHWAHLVIHGCLHLQGYDHINEEDALEMELLEIELLNTIGISNPYEA